MPHLIHRIDEALLERIVQPAVDRLPDGISCFDVAGWLNLAAVLVISAPIAFGLISGKGMALWLLVGFFSTDIFFRQRRRLASARAASRARFANPLRHDWAQAVEFWIWAGVAVAFAVSDLLTSHIDAFDLWLLLNMSGNAFARAQPRPPGFSRWSRARAGSWMAAAN